MVSRELNLKPKMTSVCQALTCIRMYQDQTHHDDQVQQGFQFLHFLHCGSFRLKVKEWFPGLRPAPLPDPDSFWTVILATSAMASTSANMVENEVKTLTGVKATFRTILMLDTLRRRGVASQLPGRFTLSHEENGPITDVAVNKWLDSVKIPVVVVASLTFASRRRNLANVTHALQLLARTFRECTIRNELEMNAETYVGTASRMMKAFVSKFRDGLEAQNFDPLCSHECANHAEDLWSVLKEHYAVLIGGGKTVSDLYQTLTSSNVTELGALNTTHPPANSFVGQIRRGSLFLKTNQETWSRRPREITQRPSDDEINFMYGLVAEMKSELANVGYALRRHNAKHPDDRDRQIIIQDVIRDWIEFKYELTIERAAAVTHLQTTVMLATVLQSWERALDLFDPYKTVIPPVREALRNTFIQLTKACDIPEDIWAHGGYHIMLADNGAYQAVTDRKEALSHFRNYLTTMSDTQGGQGSSNAGHITGWDTPLMPRDDRPPLATDQVPFWDKNPIEMRNIPNIDLTGPSSSTTPKQKPMPRRPTRMETPKAKPRPTGTPPRTPKAKARPSPPGDAQPWVIPALPVGVIEVLFVNADYAQTPVRTKHWRDHVYGFVEAQIHRSKSAFNLERKTRYLPMAAPVRGLSDRPWALAWMELIQSENLPLGKGRPTENGWSSLPVTASVAAVWLKNLLRAAGSSVPAAAAYGTHSCKATVLSWVAKAGVARELRAILGYHARGVGGTELVYARDNMAHPLREMDKVLEDIRNNKFFPDHTRSGMYRPDAQEERWSAELEDSDCSSSEDSVDEEDLEHVVVEAATDAIMPEWTGIFDLGKMDGFVYFRHPMSRVIHATADESGTHFLCGRDVSTAYLRMAGRPKVLHPTCKQCFGRNLIKDRVG